MRIEYLDGARLRRSLIAGCDFVQHQRAELNRINVFPVPDGDTGTNLALTAAAIADRMRGLREDVASVSEVADAAADAAILGARGNCGMILSHFLLGFARSLDGRGRVTAPEFATSMGDAVAHVYGALEQPVEGTILTVMREVSEEAARRATGDFVDLIEALLTRAREALARTPELLPVLARAGVVDAGAKGFVHLMEGIVRYIHGAPFVPLEEPASYDEAPSAAAAAEYPSASERFRFCTEALVRGRALPDADAVRAELKARGDSLIVIRGSDVLKVHIHTDDPEDVFAYLRTLGRLATHKAEDMVAQHEAVERAASTHVRLARRPVSIVADSGCDLPEEIVRAHGLHIVPLALIVGDRVLRDRIDITPGEFLARQESGEKATTSQPPPAAFLEAYQRAAQDGEAVLGVLLASRLSGTYASGEAAARSFRDAPLRLVDSAAASIAQGLLVLKAAELAELAMDLDAIAAELARIRRRSGIFFTVEHFDNLLASGRVGRGKVLIAGLLDIKPILGLDDAGTVVPVANVRGSRNALPRVIEELAQRIPPDAQRLRFGIVHIGRPEIVAEATAALTERFGERETIAAEASPVLATHLGRGAWAIAWMLED